MLIGDWIAVSCITLLTIAVLLSLPPLTGGRAMTPKWVDESSLHDERGHCNAPSIALQVYLDADVQALLLGEIDRMRKSLNREHEVFYKDGFLGALYDLEQFIKQAIGGEEGK